MKVILIPRVGSTSGIFHFHKIRLQFFINSVRTKVMFPFNSIPTKNMILTFLWKKGRVTAHTDMFRVNKRQNKIVLKSLISFIK